MHRYFRARTPASGHRGTRAVLSALVPALLALLALLLAAAAAMAQEGDPGLRRGTPAGRAILITVDDLPLAFGELHPRAAERRHLTRALLGTLARHRVPAVGFVVWDDVRGPADLRLLDRWLAAGHELGNHTASHPGYLQTPRDAFLADAEQGRAGLAAFLAPRAPGGRGVRFFRFPYLLEGETPEKLDAMRAYLAGSGQRNVPATVAFEDWKYEGPWVAARRRGDREELRALGASYQAAFARQLARSEELSRSLFGHDVPQVLMLHANEVGAAQWPALLDHLQRRGYRFARADEVLADPAYAEPHRFVAKEGPILWERLAAERRRDAEEVAR